MRMVLHKKKLNLHLSRSLVGVVDGNLWYGNII